MDQVRCQTPSCRRFAKHDAICDWDCCNCVSLRPVADHPWRLAFTTAACAIIASRCRSGTDDLPWIFLVRMTRPLEISKCEIDSGVPFRPGSLHPEWRQGRLQLRSHGAGVAEDFGVLGGSLRELGGQAPAPRGRGGRIAGAKGRRQPLRFAMCRWRCLVAVSHPGMIPRWAHLASSSCILGTTRRR